MRRESLFGSVLAVLALLITSVVGAVAQEATPVPGGATTVAGGLTNPRGMAWGADGTLFVALAGSGGEALGTPGVPPPLGPFRGGPTSSVVSIVDGCPVPIVEGLPSYVDALDGIIGVASVAILGDHLYGLIAGGGPAYGNPDSTVGVYEIYANGTTALIADYSAWVLANPPSQAPPEGFPNPGNPFAMVADQTSGLLWVVDAINGLVVTVATDGTINLVADLSDGHPVLTGIALAPDGGAYVGNLTAVPYVDGTAKVVRIAADGTVSDAWTGLTAVTGVALGPDGVLYAIEMATGNTDQPPFIRPGTGRLVRQTGPDGLEVVASGLDFPVALAVGPDGALYVSVPAMGAEDGSGRIVRFDVAGAAATPVAEAGAAPSCAPGATPVA